ncbi:MAG: hypothetical protein R6X02_23375 [Enhygromyxa sp.]
MRRHGVQLGVWLGSILALAACGPTIVHEPQPQPQPRPAIDPADDPLVEHEAVRAAVRDYLAALERRDVAAASALVVGETFSYYEDLRVAALRGTRAQLENWDLISLVMILQIRSKVPRAQLEGLDGRELFGFAVAEGLVGGEGPDELALDEVWLDDAREAARISISGEPIVWLRKTEDEGQRRWRIDIPEMVRQIGPAIEATAREQVIADGRLRTAYTLLVLESDESVAIEILDGPLEGEGSNAP